MNEKLYDIPGYAGYKITKSGKVYTLKFNRFLKPDFSTGYARVSLWSSYKNKRDVCLVHRLVAIVFIPNPNNLPVVNHKDGNKRNNSVYNLEWCTNEYNTRHAIEIGLIRTENDSPKAKFTKEQVFQIYKDWESVKNKKELALKYHCSDSLIGSIVLGKRWTKAYKEYYGHASTIVPRKRIKLKAETIDEIIKKYWVDRKTTIQLGDEYNLSASYIG